MTAESEPNKRITWENLEYLNEQTEKVEFYEELLGAAERSAKICGRKHDSCAHNAKRLKGIVDEQSEMGQSFFDYIFPGKK